MSDEKLPEYVEAVLEVLRGFTISGLESGDDLKYEAAVAHANGVVASARLAIHRYAREREAAALHGAADAVAALCFDEINRLGGLSADRPQEFKFGPGVQSPRLLAMNDALAAIRAMIQKDAS